MANAFAYRPEISLPDNVSVIVSRREGGHSAEPYNGFNIAEHVGDDASAVAANRRQLLEQMEGAKQIQWLNQTHSCLMVEAGQTNSPNADACYTQKASLACAVMTADCLPILMWRTDGSAVAAFHAGWRGLANDILAENFPILLEQGNKSSQWQAYIGPAIGQTHFEVGIEVLETFYEAATSEDLLDATIAASMPSKQNPLKYHLDLPAIAKAQLNHLGVHDVWGGTECTYDDAKHYYSYRRASQQGDARCGRMVSLIWRK